jgi:hypothetical protein
MSVEISGIYLKDAENKDQNMSMRRFLLVRERDLTGVSGTGIVAEGAEFTSGLAVMRWLREPYAVGVFQSVADLIAVHGHEGATHIQFLDQA